MTLVFDIETATFGKQPNSDVDVFRCISAYAIEEKKWYFYDETEIDSIRGLFKKHRVIVSFNGKKYDEPILRRFRAIITKHCHIDCYEIVKKRGMFLGFKEKESKSLLNVAKKFDITLKEEGFDYTLLNKESKVWTSADRERIKIYAQNDVQVTLEIFEHTSKFFEPFKEYLDAHDNRDYQWLVSRISVYAYKVICHFSGIPEKYADNPEHKTYPGGYVLEPRKEEVHGNVYCLDFNSLYPHVMMQANLFSHSCTCCTEEEKWKGSDLFPLMGKYCSKKFGKIEESLLTIYNERVKFKKLKDPRQYALKIVLNTIYGLCGNPVFESLYNYMSACDCTLISRESTKLAIDRFEKAGYDVLYGDTDSVYLTDVFDDEERLMMVKTGIINTIQKNLPFPLPTFDMGVDDKIKHIWFPKHNGKFKKKHYLYVNDKDELIIKGLPMIKSDSSGIGLRVFDDLMRENVRQGHIHHKYSHVDGHVSSILEENPSAAARRFRVWEPDQYKLENDIHRQISLRYGVGTHMLIPNKFVGVGKSIRYCTLEEFKEAKLGTNAIVLNKMWNELEPFLDRLPPTPKQIRHEKGQKQLELWSE
ncbi:MAG: hypothetical protein DRR04_12075 [Gammaproteobacteria bacterium]|nr:MAG: hypothetical protein DRR04_12075 [Gammaproteobacteria bacterium]